jgi:dihydrofolate synthase/folylpolyglutamate synthase
MVSMPHWPAPLKTQQDRINLEPMHILMHALGNPHLRLPQVIHVAGTNGKGSTCAYLKAIFENAGYSVHMYTSPHLLQFNDRIMLNGTAIFDDYLFEICEKVRNIVEKNNLVHSFFEATTAAAFIAFSEVPADILIIETGLGGRLDATNIIENPLATIITPISYDHMEYLGPTLPFIAGEKAGIIKNNIPCIIAAQTESVLEILLSKCTEMQAESICFGYDYMISKETNEFLIEGKSFYEKFPFPKLLGDHQILNASTVIAGILSNIFRGYKISKDNIKAGLANVDWPGRLQKTKYLGKEVIIDGAHNTGGAQVLAVWMKDNLPTHTALILGMTKNRDVTAFSSYFKDIVDVIYCVKVMSEPSSYSAEKIAFFVEENSIKTVICDNLEEAIIKASSSYKNIVITGSLFLAADCMKLTR